MRALVATITAVVLVCLATTAATAAPARIAKLTAPEQKWVTPVLVIWNAMNSDLAVVGKQTTAGKGTALIIGTAANKTLNTTLADLVTCTDAMRKAKAPPSKRLKPFAASMKGACMHFRTGALGVARGISSINKNNSKLGTLQIQQGFREFDKGSGQLGTARKQLLAIGGKNIFSS